MGVDFPPEPPPAAPPAAEPPAQEQPAAAIASLRLERQPRMSWERTAQDFVRAHLGQQWDTAAFKSEWAARRSEGDGGACCAGHSDRLAQVAGQLNECRQVLE